MFRAIAHSVRRKLMLVVVATTFVALTAASAALIVYDLRSYLETSLENLTTQADILARATAPALTFNDVKSASEDLRLLQGRPQIRAAALYTADGRVFASFAQREEARVPDRPGATGHRVDGARLILFHPVIEKGERIGTIFLSADYLVAERAAAFLRIILSVMAFSALIAMLVSAWLQSWLTRPILEIADVARQVMERRDYGLKARKTTDDEIGALVDAFNAMIAEVGRRERDLEASDKRKDEFLATLAHELRNPLAPLSNALQILRAAPDESMKEKAREIMERQLAQMVRLVDDLLDVSRITTGKLAIKTDRVDLGTVIRNAVDTANPLIAAKRHALEVQLPSEPIALDGDATRLAQVFANLLNNAAKYTPEGGKIAIRARTDGHDVLVSVTDNGIGIAREMLPNIFEMFTQADQSLERLTAGLGVGLTLARRLAELHGGRIEGGSEGLGRGSEFTVRLPAASGSLRSAATQGPHAASPRAPHRILLVDDNVDFSMSLATLLRSMGNEVQVFADGFQALKEASRFEPEFAFLDIGMPGMNGYDLARRLREESNGRRMVITAITGWGRERDKQKAREAGFDHHLVKPVEMDRVKAILEGSGPAL